MSWKEEHGVEFDVPALIDYMVKEKLIEDVSWHNDAMPRFDIIDPEDDENRIILWVDHPIASQRERGPGTRFLVQAGPDGMDEIETDDLEEAIAKVCEYSDKHIPNAQSLNPQGIVKEWLRSLRRDR